MMCVLWQESSFGQQSPTGGMESYTKACIDKLTKRGCGQKFKSYHDFTSQETPCEKAEAANAFVQIAGLDHYRSWLDR